MRPLKDYIKDDAFEDPETHIWFENLETLLHCQIVGHCGCGQPEENLKLIHDMLAIHEDYKKKNSFNLTAHESIEMYRERKEKFKNYIIENWEKFHYFFFYVMNDKDIMEHGTSVPGWICDDNFMEALKIWHDGYEKDGE